MPPTNTIPGRGGSSPYPRPQPPPHPVAPDPPADSKIWTFTKAAASGVVKAILPITVALLLFYGIRYFTGGGGLPTPGPGPDSDPSSARVQGAAMSVEWLTAYSKRLREAAASIRDGKATPGDAASALGKAWADDRSAAHRSRLAPLEAEIATGGVEGSPAHRTAYAAFLETVADGVDDAAAGQIPRVGAPRPVKMMKSPAAAGEVTR